jgi:phosphoribosylglycinamide formyltransferase 1
MPEAKPKTRVVIVASGEGTNAQAIIEASQREPGPYVVAAVICDRPSAGVIARAEKLGIPLTLLRRKDYLTREAFDAALVAALRQHHAELVVLAGFMRIVGKPVLEAFPGAVINIHPALLPSFPGLEAQTQALKAGVRVSGCTVHFVDDGVDTGPIIAQAVVDVRVDDDLATLTSRIRRQELALYPEVVRLITSGKVALEDRRVEVATIKSVDNWYFGS